MSGRQRGAVGLLLMLLLVGTLSALLLGGALAARHRDPQSDTTAALAMASQSLAGYARAQRCMAGSGSVTSHLPCPNLGAPEGIAAPACPGMVRGRLPWRTLGLPPLRDAAGECLWYERSPAGARVISPGATLAGQLRADAGTAPVCGGHYGAVDYLESGGNDRTLEVSAVSLSLPAGC